MLRRSVHLLGRSLDGRFIALRPLAWICTASGLLRNYGLSTAEGSDHRLLLGFRKRSGSPASRAIDTLGAVHSTSSHGHRLDCLAPAVGRLCSGTGAYRSAATRRVTWSPTRPGSQAYICVRSDADFLERSQMRPLVTVARNRPDMTRLRNPSTVACIALLHRTRHVRRCTDAIVQRKTRIPS